MESFKKNLSSHLFPCIVWLLLGAYMEPIWETPSYRTCRATLASSIERFMSTSIETLQKQQVISCPKLISLLTDPPYTSGLNLIISLSHIISLLSIIHTIYSIIQTNIQGLHVSTVYGHLQALLLKQSKSYLKYISCALGSHELTLHLMSKYICI